MGSVVVLTPEACQFENCPAMECLGGKRSLPSKGERVATLFSRLRDGILPGAATE